MITTFKQLICWLKTRHGNRRLIDFHAEPITPELDEVYKIYHCKDCDYVGKELFDYFENDDYE